jgi:hypothetical protein
MTAMMRWLVWRPCAEAHAPREDSLQTEVQEHPNPLFRSRRAVGLLQDEAIRGRNQRASRVRHRAVRGSSFEQAWSS